MREVKYIELSKGDEIIIEGQVWTVRATDMPGGGEIMIWATDPNGNYETLYRRVEESVNCPVYGE